MAKGVGGGKDVKKLCMKRGWIWVPEQMDVAQGGIWPNLKFFTST